jgi:hypothetical protein
MIPVILGIAGFYGGYTLGKYIEHKLNETDWGKETLKEIKESNITTMLTLPTQEDDED